MSRRWDDPTVDLHAANTLGAATPGSRRKVTTGNVYVVMQLVPLQCGIPLVVQLMARC
jgi:hypothetical protein